MTDSGNHGGSTSEEVRSALLLFSRRAGGVALPLPSSSSLAPSPLLSPSLPPHRPAVQQVTPLAFYSLLSAWKSLVFLNQNHSICDSYSIIRHVESYHVEELMWLMTSSFACVMGGVLGGVLEQALVVVVLLCLLLHQLLLELLLPPELHIISANALPSIVVVFS